MTTHASFELRSRHYPIALGISGVVIAAIFAGALVRIPRVAPLLVAIALAAVLFFTEAWSPVAWFILVGLATFSFGFNNIPLSLGSATLPLVDAIFVWALVSAAIQGRVHLRIPGGRALLIPLVLLTLIAAARLAVDLRAYGVTAARDGLLVLELWGVFLGLALGRRLTTDALGNRISLLLGVAVLWLAILLPLQNTLPALGPTVGIQRPEALFSIQSAALVPALAIVWFLRRRGLLSAMLIGIAAWSLLLAQVRGAYIALGVVALGLGVVRVLRKDSQVERSPRSMGAMLVGAAVCILVVLAIAPRLPGRLGAPASVETVKEQLLTLAGKRGPGAGSLSHRLDAWPRVVHQVRAKPMAALVGLGLGPDLFGGFRNPAGVLVRKPHNDFLEIGARLGLPALCLFLSFLGALVVLTIRRSKHTGLTSWTIALHCVMLLTSFVQPLFSFAYGSILYTVLAGTLLGVRPRDQQRVTSSRTRPNDRSTERLSNAPAG